MYVVDGEGRIFTGGGGRDASPETILQLVMLDSGRVAAVPVTPNKRKGPSIDSLFESKRAALGIYALRQEFNHLLQMKKEWLYRQRRSSLLVEPCRLEDDAPIHQFAPLYRKISNAPMSAEEHQSQLAMIQQIIKESIIIEWPRTVSGLGPGGEDEIVEIDCPPLIHRARNVVKCRSSHPTMRVKICAIGKCADQPKTVEAFFRATLVKISADTNEPRQVAGRIILTQREGTPATKAQDQCGAIVDSEGRVVASQAASDTHSYILLDKYDELQAKTTPLKYENGVLCATFPEMGVALNSMVDRRQLATRYTIQVEVAINIDNKLMVQHTVFSHPFLIAITNDQTEPLLLSIFWHRMLKTDTPDPIDANTDLPALPWHVIRQCLAHFPKAQCAGARSLHHSELLHLQCMLLLPRFVRCTSDKESDAMEFLLYGNIREQGEHATALEKIRERLLNEEVKGDVLIEKSEVISERCFSILDLQTQLKHSVWQWLFKATEMLLDVGHKLCPPPLLEKKGTKTKKQLAACDEYLTMATLFNRGFISFSSAHRVCRLLSELSSSPHIASTSSDAASNQGSPMLVRFCDENAGCLSFAFGANEEKPIFGSVSADQIKDFKQGLPEALMDEPYPAKFERLVRLDFAGCKPGHECALSLPKKRDVFHYYRTQRQHSRGVSVRDEETRRVNPFTGEELPRKSTPSPPPEKEDGSEGAATPSATSLFSLMQRLAPNLPLPPAVASSPFSPIVPILPPLLTTSTLPSPPPTLVSPTCIATSMQLPPNFFGHLLPEQTLQLFLRNLQGFHDINTPLLPSNSLFSNARMSGNGHEDLIEGTEKQQEISMQERDREMREQSSEA